MKTDRWSPALSLAILTPLLAAADPPPPAAIAFNDSVVVSAHRRPTATDDLGASVTVIGRREIDTRQATSLVELLRTVPGVEIVQGGGPGRVASALIRGTASSHALVLIDGVRVNDGTTGAFDLADLSTDAIERIEVLRGPQSALYGSEALGGVISIFTRRGQGAPQIGGAAELGTGGRRRLEASVHGSGDRIDYALTASGGRIATVSAASERAGNRELDAHELGQLTARVGASLSATTRLELSSRVVDSETGLDGFDFLLGPVDDPNYRQERRAWTSRLALERTLGGSWLAQLQVGVVDEALEGIDPDTSFNNFRVDSELLSVGISAHGVTGVGTLSVGAGVEQRSGTNLGSFDEEVDLRSLWAEHEFRLGERVDLTVGGRWDDHSAFGSELTYRATTTVRPRAGSRLWASYGTAFKAPTLNDLYFPFFGNPDLAPETSRGAELGGAHRTVGGTELSLTLFAIELDDLIGFDETFRAVNIARARSRGAELAVAATLAPGLELSSSYTYTDAEDRRTGEPLPRRPTHRASLSLLLPHRGRWSGSMTLLTVADRTDSDGSEMDDYHRVDGSLGFDVNDGVQLYLRCENLLGESYEEVNGFTSPGLGVTMGVRWRPPER